jgi:hypothetical protein
MTLIFARTDRSLVPGRGRFWAAPQVTSQRIGLLLRRNAHFGDAILGHVHVVCLRIILRDIAQMIIECRGSPGLVRDQSRRRRDANRRHSIRVLIGEMIAGRGFSDELRGRSSIERNRGNVLTCFPETAVPIRSTGELVLANEHHHADRLALGVITSTGRGEPTFFKEAAGSTYMLRHGPPP